MDHLHGLAADTANHLVGTLLIAENVLHVGLGDLEQSRHCRRDGRASGKGYRPGSLRVAIRPGDRVDQQIRVIAQVVLGPHDLVAGHLLRRHDGLLDAGQCTDLAQLGQLHILQALRIFSQAHMAHAALDVVHKPALAVDHNNRYALACNVADILQHLAAAHDVFSDAHTLDAFLAHFPRADGNQGFFQRLVVLKVCGCVAFLDAADGFKNADGLGLFFQLVILGHKNNIRRRPVKLVLVDDLRPVGRIVVVDFLVTLTRHARDNKAVFRVGLVLALGVQVKEYGTVSIVDRLKADALAVVFGIFLVLVDGA